MKKNKALRHQKQKQKKALKSQRREKIKAKYTPKPTSRLKEIDVGMQMSEQDLNFWYAHGLNYILSDYGTGQWTPMFEGIYEGNISSYDDILGSLVKTYGEGVEWPEDVKVAYAWLIQKPTVIYAYAKVAEQQSKINNPESNPVEAARLPHNGHVWELFHTLKKGIIRNDVKPVVAPQP
jgi:hypothetical protein